jgi:hypothetical protein
LSSGSLWAFPETLLDVSLPPGDAIAAEAGRAITTPRRAAISPLMSRIRI